MNNDALQSNPHIIIDLSYKLQGPYA